jgi:hypothetical protein
LLSLLQPNTNSSQQWQWLLPQQQQQQILTLFLKLNFLYFHFYLQSHRPSPNAHPLTIFLLFKQFNDTFTLFIYPLTKSNKRINTKC